METDIIVRDSKICKNFNQQLVNNKLKHAYIIQSEDENSSELFAVYFAKMIFCRDGNVCGVCDMCKKTNAGTHSDLKIVGKDKGILVDDITKVVNDVYIKPIESENKVYVLCNFDEASEICQNKLLKTLEEPPKNVYFFLCVKNMSNLLQTIKSRASKLVVDSFSSDIIYNFLIENGEDKNNALIISEISAGSVGQALSNTKNNLFIPTVDLVYDIFLNCKKSSDALYYVAKILKSKQEIANFFTIFQFVLEEMVNFKTNGEENVKCKAYLEIIEQIADDFSLQAIVKINNQIAIAKEKMKFNCNINSVIDMFILKFLEEKFKWK